MAGPASTPTYVFLFGAPRSGTTWLQNMLGSRPEVVTPQESNLFNFYVAPWQREWLRGLGSSAADWRRNRYNGLSAILTAEEFDSIVGDVVRRVYDAALALKPSAEVLLDKVPGYTLCGPLIRHYLPAARLIHLIRDGRDVAASMLRASRGFGHGWSPGRVDDAAWLWRSNVEAGRELAGPGYLELRFEELRSPRGAEVLRQTFAFCGVELSLDSAQAVLERFSLERSGGEPPSSISWGGEVQRRLGVRPVEPEDFLGVGQPGGWRERFGAYERWLFDREAGGLLVELGYEADRSWGRTAPVVAWGHEARWSTARLLTLMSRAYAKVGRNLHAPRREAPDVVRPAPTPPIAPRSQP